MRYINKKYIKKSHCILCGGKGELLYCNLKDRLYGCEGQWNIKKCPVCGLMWLYPMLAPEYIEEAYKNYFTHTNPRDSLTDSKHPTFIKKTYQKAKAAYLAINFGYGFSDQDSSNYLVILLTCLPRRRELLRKSIMWLPFMPGGKLLDIGCGNGKFLLRMRALGWQVEGVEVDPKAALQARSLGLSVRLGELQEQGYAENSFDAITLNHVIEHVAEPLALLRECLRILSPKGMLALVTPNPGSLGHRLFRENWRGLEPPRHLFLYSRRVMAELLCRAGFSHYEMKTTAAIAPKIFIASRNIARQGHFHENTRVTIGEKIRARAFALMEQWRLRSDPDAGEELVVIARKEA